MKYEVEKANDNIAEEAKPQPGSIEALDPFSAPVPGQSLTTEPGSQKFERPPEMVNPDEATMFVIGRLEEDREAKEVQLSQIASGVPIEYIVNTIAFTGFSEGMWTPDVAELIKPPLAMYFIITAMAENIPMVVFNPRESNVGKVPVNEMADSMSALNPEGYEAVHNNLNMQKAGEEQMANSFLGSPEEAIPMEETMPMEEGLSNEELMAGIPEEGGMLS